MKTHKVSSDHTSPKQKPDTSRQLKELQKMVREVREGKVPAEQHDEHAKLFEERSARLSQDLLAEITRLRGELGRQIARDIR
jgi:hypothetical protein